jgi:nitrogen fixation NifU-like protein
MFYSSEVMDHFSDPRHIGMVDDANGVGLIGDPNCGDFMCISIKVEDWKIVDIGFLCKGCPAAIASGSATTEIASGMMLEKAMCLAPEDVSNHLGGLPKEKMHCSNLGVDALRYAMADYLDLLSEEK